MSSPALPTSPATVPDVAVACPSCGAKAAVCTAKIVTPNAYWRCQTCGDVWTPSRIATRHRGWRA